LQWEDLAAAVALAQANLTKEQQDLAELEKGPDKLRRQQRITALEVAQTDLDAAREVLSSVQAKGSPQAVAAQDARVLSTAEELRSAEHALSGMKSDGAATSELAGQESLVTATRVALATSAGILVAITAGADPLELGSKEAKLSLAQAQLVDAELDLAGLLDGPDPLNVAATEAEVARLTSTLAQQEEDLAELLAGADPLDVALKVEQVALARETLAVAEEDLAELQAGPELLEVALREADVRSAQQALADSKQRLEDAALKAPFAGFVSVVSVEEGDEVQANTAIVEIVDPTVVEVDGIVDEIDVLSVRVGTRTEVTVDALPDRMLEGTVTEITPGARNQQGVVTYPIRIQVEVPEGLVLREGLSSVANIVLREERNVLLLPQQALYGTFDQPVVKVLNGKGNLEERPVELGNSDEFWITVRAGLREGDQVAMETADVGTSRFSFGQFRRVTGASGRGGSRGGSRGGRR
jgi:RND family efflux transporter MFP subunit